MSAMSESSGFWDFSIRVYGQPGVADACQSECIPRADSMEVRAEVKATELAAERLQQIGLESLSEPAPEQPLAADEQLEAAVFNLTCYLTLMNLNRGQASSDDLATVVTAAIPDSSYDTVVLALTAAAQ